MGEHETCARVGHVGAFNVGESAEFWQEKSRKLGAVGSKKIGSSSRTQTDSDEGLVKESEGTDRGCVSEIGEAGRAMWAGGAEERKWRGAEQQGAARPARRFATNPGARRCLLSCQ